MAVKNKKAKPPVKTKPVRRPGPRKLKTPQYKHFRLHKRIKHPSSQIIGAYKLFAQACRQLVKQWKLIGSILLIYAVLNIVFVRGFGGGVDLASIKDAMKDLISGSWASLATSLSLYGVLLSSAGNTTSQAASAYQSFLIIITSLALIWALRQGVANTKTDVRESFYRGNSQLVPFLLVLTVVGLQLIPLALGGGVYNLVIGTGLAVTSIEKFIWLLILLLLVLLSVYMLSSSLFALYIVTLPGMSPLQALRSARKLAMFRRWTIMRKILFLPVALLVLSALIMVPVILFATSLAVWLFFFVTIIGLAVMHSYMYLLYRKLL